MARFVAIVDRAGAARVAEDLSDACETLTLGGSREHLHRRVRDGFALAVLGHSANAEISERAGVLTAHVGSAPPPIPDAGDAAPRERLSGRTIALRWDATVRELRVVTEPNGMLPVYYARCDDRLVVATEPKAIWRVLPSTRAVDVDGLLDIYRLGHCVGARTLLAGVTCMEPGTAYDFTTTGVEVEPLPVPSFETRRRADPAGALNDGLRRALEPYRRVTDRVTVALSGGMDSRYVLAGANETWQHVESFTFGGHSHADVRLAKDVARTVGISNRHFAAGDDFLAGWAGYAVWRTDGLVSALHSQGIDASLSATASCRHALNGIGGEVLLGGFLRPRHLYGNASPEEAARIHASARRGHRRPLSEMLKPELLAAAADDTMERVRRRMARYPSERLGSMLLPFWLRHYCSRFSIMGLVIDSPWLEYVGPLVDPHFVDAAAGLPMRDRFLSRAHTRAIARLDPRLVALPVTRYDVSPRHGWPVLLAARAALALGLRRRHAPLVDYSACIRAHRAAAHALLTTPRARAHGFFLPAYVDALFEELDRGENGAVNELGTALSLELWRRMFVDGDLALARPPLAELPAARLASDT